MIPSSGGTPQPIDRYIPGLRCCLAGGTFFTPATTRISARCAPASPRSVATTRERRLSRPIPVSSTQVRLRSDSGYLVYLRAGTLLAQPFDLARRRVTAEPRAIARRVPSFGPTGAADFSVSRRGVLAYQTYINRSQFIWVDRTGKRLSAASPAGINANYVRLSPDGRWLAAVPFDVDRGVPEIWLYDAGSGAGRKIVFGPAISHAPVWSPDSRRLVYIFGP